MEERLKILSKAEIDTLYARPRFTYEERMEYFSLSSAEKCLLQELRSVKSQVYFVLQLGYFKAKRMFFSFSLDETREDVQHVLGQYFDTRKVEDSEALDKRTRLRQQRLILDLTGYRSLEAEERKQLEEKAQHAATVCGKPIYVFRELMHYLAEQRIVAPGYRFGVPGVSGRKFTVCP